jgi:hypothetical protein
MQATSPTNQYRAIFISDVHLGTRGCKAEFLLDFLKHNDADVIYLGRRSRRARLGARQGGRAGDRPAPRRLPALCRNLFLGSGDPPVPRQSRADGLDPLP